MKLLTLPVLLLPNLASAHYIFQQLSSGSQTFGVYENIRKNTNQNSPVTDLDSDDLRCNVGGASGADTTVWSAKAGDAFTFTSDVAVYHQGPISLYMSKADGSVNDYDGSGDWFKIFDFGPDFSSGQAEWPMRSTYEYTIPTCIADGEYLLRIQSLAIHNPGSTPQFYISCAQVNVTGGGSTTPSATAKFPGAIHADDPGYTANIYSDFTSYTVPGPEVFSC
ncbi:putative endo-beta-1,4-glucanase D [Dichotomopilus funicola]|uniref:lytic cellulose monooxygenase (C4-dehydrogenating) n=1 Tax=Dichotomopilus funicola TaxID=1934379 RepID=A0AAN6UXD8_9PEZI|nr:putative endo-beta-1,4-glucanase D [Dichotomopilus funicola]